MVDRDEQQPFWFLPLPLVVFGAALRIVPSDPGVAVAAVVVGMLPLAVLLYLLLLMLAMFQMESIAYCCCY